MVSQILTEEQLSRLVNAKRVSDEEISPGVGADSHFLRLLSSLRRENLSQLFTERRCVRGEVVIREGETGEALYMIWSGRVLVYMGDLEKPTFLGYRGPGEIVGEMALLENRPRSASIVAVEDLRLLEVSRENFTNLLKSEPSVGLSIMEGLSARLRQAQHVRSKVEVSERYLISQITELQTEKQHLLELQHLRQETSDLIIHDLRTPLGSISLALNMLEMVLPEDVLEENQQLLGIARSTCDRMLRLVDSLLEVSRMESGETQLQLSEFDLGLMAKTVFGNFLVTQDRHIEMHIHQAEELPLIVGDRDMLERVVANLLDNALKYTPDGGQVTLTTGTEGAYLVISVSDTGPGIPERDRERIFERFAQVRGATHGRRGFGLGLAYCKLAVEAHGGSIWVEPAGEGLGSKFTFTLPLDRLPD